MYCISVSFKKTPLLLRQRFAFSMEEQKALLSKLMDSNMIDGGVIISTCNRSELYFSGEKSEREKIENLLSEFKHIERENIKRYCLYYQGKKAVKHLYKVVCGLDSMVLGEDEILRQAKEAYLFSKENGFTDSELNIIFQDSFHCAKLSKSETALSKTPVSIGTLTANTVENYMKENLTEDICENSSVLVIGATGKIGSIVVKNLISKGFSVIATRRKHSFEEGFLQIEGEESPPQGNALRRKGVQWIGFEHRYEYLKEVKAIVSATSSPHYTLTKEKFEKNSDKDNPYLLIDLAVPYDIDKEIGDKRHISLLDIDYFNTRSKENSNIKLEEVEKVNHMIQECVDDILKELYIRNFKVKISGTDKESPPQGNALRRKDKESPPQDNALRRKDKESPPQDNALRRKGKESPPQGKMALQQKSDQWFNKMLYYLKDVLDSEQFLQVLEKIYQKEVKGEE